MGRSPVRVLAGHEVKDGHGDHGASGPKGFFGYSLIEFDKYVGREADGNPAETSFQVCSQHAFDPTYAKPNRLR